MSNLMTFPPPSPYLSPLCHSLSLANTLVTFLTSNTRYWTSTAFSRFTQHPFLSLLYFGLVYIVYRYARAQRIRASAVAEQQRRDDKKWFERVWHSPRWIVLAGLCEFYLHKAVPYGFWGEAEGRSLQGYADKQHLRRLLRMGVFPLFIQDGGLNWRRDAKWYMQSYTRACFVFLVPMGHGYTDPDTVEPERRPFVDFIRSIRDNQEGYRVCVSMEPSVESCTSTPPPNHIENFEVGGFHWFEPFVPFTRDRVLQIPRGSLADDFEDLATKEYPGLLKYWSKQRPIVRIEAPHWDPARLDSWVYAKAREAGVEEIWDADEMRARTVRWCRRLQLDVPESLRPPPRVGRA